MKYWPAVFIILFPICVFTQTVNFNITLGDSLKPISPFIFGTNQTFGSGENWSALRQGGNRMTGYNWENNASSAGEDYYNYSDNYLTYLLGITNSDSANVPGIVTTKFQNKAINLGAYSLVTLQMAGYAARDKKGTVNESETAPSSRWEEIKDEKGNAFSLNPDTSDGYVYMDEYVNFLVSKFGDANTRNGVKAYSLDNEPALWPSTHPRIHPSPTTCKEIISRSESLAKAVKKIDPYAEIFGPALYGFAAYNNFQSAPDWSQVSTGKSYKWFIDYYLDKMKAAGDSAGERLLDVLDVHWYPEAIGDHRITDNAAATYKDKAARVQAPRTLWDKTYIENSWIGQYGKAHLPLIPNLLASIKKYYPGTKLAFTEFTYGGENDISGAIAAADVLGIFAKYGIYYSAFWPVNSPSSYIPPAYKMYTDYDGSMSGFGGYYVPTNSSDSVDCSIYGAVSSGSSEMSLIVINKNFNDDIQGSFNISSSKNFISGRVWELDSTGTAIKEIASVNNISGNKFSYTLPRASVCRFVLKSSDLLSADNSGGNGLPDKYSLSAYPNPFNPSCTIAYNVSRSRESRIDIISIYGTLIRSYDNIAGAGNVLWNGTNMNNERVASGVYLAVLRSGGEVLTTQKLMLLK